MQSHWNSLHGAIFQKAVLLNFWSVVVFNNIQMMDKVENNNLTQCVAPPSQTFKLRLNSEIKKWTQFISAFSSLQKTTNRVVGLIVWNYKNINSVWVKHNRMCWQVSHKTILKLHIFMLVIQGNMATSNTSCTTAYSQALKFISKEKHALHLMRRN
jgi:hypothetical protein